MRLARTSCAIWVDPNAMEPLLFLVHRIPFPPNKGDKVRSFHLLEFLASRYRIHLGTFVDDMADLEHVPRLGQYCASLNVEVLRPSLARIRSLAGLWSGEPLTLGYYRDAAMGEWASRVVRQEKISKVVVFSAAMAQYVPPSTGLRVVVDFVDVDSAKWTQYAQSRPWPLSTIFGREGRQLLAFERSVARKADASVFVTPAEAELFRTLAPECSLRVHHAQNGVDIDYFSPVHELENPFSPDEEAIVFTGAMDYWPNVDAVCWFVHECLPAILAARPRARFYIVGMEPSSPVLALVRPGQVVVTGRVPDVRPYLKHASVVVAPLRVARGIQNKVLEAMAMARPVAASAAAADALSAVPGVDCEVAATAQDLARKTVALMDSTRGRAVGIAARARVLSDYRWATNLAPFEDFLNAADAMQVGAE
jgi:sugar transferase (PEP-CTERM/EpsH1 system associated)